jgi:hypothetical protein
LVEFAEEWKYDTKQSYRWCSSCSRCTLKG